MELQKKCTFWIFSAKVTCSFQPFSLSEGTKKRVFKKGVKHKVKLSETPPSSNLLPSPQPPHLELSFVETFQLLQWQFFHSVDGGPAQLLP